VAIEKNNPTEDIELEIEAGNDSQIELPGMNMDGGALMLDDGSAIVNPAPETEDQETFYTNLSELLEDSELNNISANLTSDYEYDKDARGDWLKTYTEGLDLLGFKYEERSKPFANASGVTHPLLAETVTQFQAQAYKELLPPEGPIRTQIVGEITPEIEEQAQRVKEFMNYQISYEMEEYDQDLDQMLFHLPLAGSAFKKVYYDEVRGRAVSKFVPAEDVVVPYGTTDLNSCERLVHVVKMMSNELRKKQFSKLYRDIKISPSDESEDIAQSKYDELDGIDKPINAEEIVLLEFHCDLDIAGFEDKDKTTGEPTGIKLPYVVTIDEGSGKVLSIYRNYAEEDPLRKKIQYFVHYKFLPGLGFYGFGLIHMLGGLSRTATSALRQLIDAGTLSNLPAGFKARGLRVRDDDQPLQPGEFRDVDAPGGAIRESLMLIPYKEPSQTLFALLGFVVDAGRRFASIADNKMGEGSQANPVGTTMAIMERGTKVMNAIHKRLHHAQKLEFKLLAKVFAESLPPEYPYAVLGGNRTIKQQDFDERVDILPISDPNIFSMSQRVTLAQSQLQMATSNPQMHNMHEAFKRMYEALGVRDIDKILPPPQQPQPEDPGMENSKSLQMMKLQAFQGQAHMAHIEAHRAFMSSYLVANNPPTMGILQSHISEHISLMAREEIEAKNAPLMEEQAAQFGGQLPPELMQQFQMQNEKEIAERITEATIEMVSEEQEMMNRDEKDPLIDLKQQEINLKAQEIEQNKRIAEEKLKIDNEKLGFEEEKLDQKDRMDQEKIKSQEDIALLRSETSLAGKRG
tara:strand:- start:4627 stop:7032 length:2406 start_codon:yes stop_codon:yes gene_type:complete